MKLTVTWRASRCYSQYNQCIATWHTPLQCEMKGNPTIDNTPRQYNFSNLLALHFTMQLLFILLCAPSLLLLWQHGPAKPATLLGVSVTGPSNVSYIWHLLTLKLVANMSRCFPDYNVIYIYYIDWNTNLIIIMKSEFNSIDWGMYNSK